MRESQASCVTAGEPMPDRSRDGVKTTRTFSAQIDAHLQRRLVVAPAEHSQIQALGYLCRRPVITSFSNESSNGCKRSFIKLFRARTRAHTRYNNLKTTDELLIHDVDMAVLRWQSVLHAGSHSAPCGYVHTAMIPPMVLASTCARHGMRHV